MNDVYTALRVQLRDHFTDYLKADNVTYSPPALTVCPHCRIHCSIILDTIWPVRNVIKTAKWWTTLWQTTDSIPKKRPSDICAGCWASKIRIWNITLPMKSWICSFLSRCSSQEV